MSDPVRKPVSPLFRLALELGPLVLFFAVFSKWGIFVATGVFMVTSIFSLAYSWFAERRIAPMPLVSTVLVLVLGGLTLWLRDDTFIKLKVTVVNVIFGLILLVGLLFRKLLVKHLLGDALRLTDEGWRVLTYWWIGYFFFLAALNEGVWRNTTTETWVTFKTIALPGLTLLFFLGLSPVMARYDQTRERPSDEPPPA